MSKAASSLPPRNGKQRRRISSFHDCAFYLFCIIGFVSFILSKKDIFRFSGKFTFSLPNRHWRGCWGLIEKGWGGGGTRTVELESGDRGVVTDLLQEHLRAIGQPCLEGFPQYRVKRLLPRLEAVLQTCYVPAR